MNAQVRERRGAWARAHYVAENVRCQASAVEVVDPQGFVSYALIRGDGSGVRIHEGCSGTIHVEDLDSGETFAEFRPLLPLVRIVPLVGAIVG